MQHMSGPILMRQWPTSPFLESRKTFLLTGIKIPVYRLLSAVLQGVSRPETPSKKGQQHGI